MEPITTAVVNSVYTKMNISIRVLIKGTICQKCFKNR